MTISQGVFAQVLMYCFIGQYVVRNTRYKDEPTRVQAWCTFMLWFVLNLAGLGIYSIWRALS